MLAPLRELIGIARVEDVGGAKPGATGDADAVAEVLKLVHGVGIAVEDDGRSAPWQYFYGSVRWTTPINGRPSGIFANR